jgi:hypothetical protein
MAKKRDTMQSKAGRKLYAVRDEEGQFADVQSYEKAHGQDVRRKSAAEKAATKKAKKAVKPARPRRKKQRRNRPNAASERAERTP